MPLIDAGQHVPRQCRGAVMQDMQVVVEKEQTEERAFLDDRRALLMIVGKAMLGIGAQARQRGAAINEAEEEEQERHVADGEHPPEHGGGSKSMPRPEASAIARTTDHLDRLVPEERAEDDGRADGQAADQSQIEFPQRATSPAETVPICPGEIVGFRILDRIGQVFVAVMGEMAFPVDMIGKPERNRRKPDRIVEPLMACRMMVDHLVLQGPVPGDQPGPQWHEDQKRNVAPEICEGDKSPVDQKGQCDGRPFDARNARYCDLTLGKMCHAVPIDESPMDVQVKCVLAKLIE